jgi:O-antigen/teichoic acid export membrane protein
VYDGENQAASGSTPESNSPGGKEAHRAVHRRVLRGVAWTAAAKILGQIIAWSCTIFVARLLDPTDYGLIGMSGVFVGFVQLVTEMGLANAVVFLRTLTRQQIAQLNGLALGVSLAAMAFSMAVAPLVARLYGEARLTPIIIVMSVSFVIMGLKAVPYGLMERAMDFRYLALLEIGQTAVAGPLTLFLAWRGYGYWALVIGVLAGHAFGTSVMVLRDPRGFAVPRPSALGEAIRLSYHLVVARVAWYIYSNADYAVIGRRLGADPVGAYTLAFTIASAPVDKITALLVRVTRPAFAAVQGDPGEVKRVFLSTSAALAFITIPASVGLAVLAPDLLPFAFGEKWTAAVMPLVLLSLATPIRSLAPLFPVILNATGDSRFAMLINLAAVVVMPIAFLAASFAGLSAVAAVWVLVYPLLVLPAATRVARRVGLTGREYLVATLPPVLGAAVMGAGVMAGRNVLPTDWPALARLGLLVGLGITIFFAVMFTFFRTRTMDYIRAIKSLRNR